LDEAGERRRWLLALAKRIERAEHAPLKDEEKAKRVLPFIEQLRELERRNAGPRCAACREEIRLCRRMVEEFRISVFAPEMGTAFPCQRNGWTRRCSRRRTCVGEWSERTAAAFTTGDGDNLYSGTEHRHVTR
jgi:hypothetical protein